MLKEEIVEKFNTILYDTTVELQHHIGVHYVMILKGIQFMFPRFGLEVFQEKMMKYKEHILTRNEEYFLNEVDVVEEVGDKYRQYLGDILNFKKIFPNLDNDSKENLWDILQALMILCEKYHS
jgi:hypothetical protein